MNATLEAAKQQGREYTKEQLQIALKCNVACADTDGKYYRHEDLRWVRKPSLACMGGVLGPKAGVLPAVELVVAR